MSAYRLGSLGPEVQRLQRRLAELGLYRGPLDGIFGGGTESAVRGFQRTAGLGEDGVVGPLTWARLFPAEEAPPPALASGPLERRCLALTASFETAQPPPECFCGLAGDFDGQGLSFGALQWNLGQGSLQPLLAALDARAPQVLDEVFHVHAATLRAVLLAPRREQLAWARSIQDPRHRLDEPWRGLFKTLGRREECQQAQAEAAAALHATARALCARFRLGSQRGLALMFDVVVQNGSIPPIVAAQIDADAAHLDGAAPADEAEVARLRIIAERRAAAARPKYVEDVRRRKLTIAEGRGWVHGRYYDLAAQFGLDLTRLADG